MAKIKGSMGSQSVDALPDFPNRFEDDLGLNKILRDILPKGEFTRAETILRQAGASGPADWDDLACLADKHPPELSVRNRFGTRVDEIEFHPSYRTLKAESYGRGIIANYFPGASEGFPPEFAEVVKFAHGYIFSQSEQGLYCPICMTDGTAYLIERFGSEDQKARFLPHLTSTNLDTLWEGAMFLTEKAGGSDVGASQTIAQPAGGGKYALFGEKWFCSNAGAELAMVLARPEGAPPGTRGLGLFALRRHTEDGSLNKLRTERLKDKLGTRSMPTGEIILEGAEAELIGSLERGFGQMVEMLSLSRLYNAVASVALVRRVLCESVRYARTRRTFGKQLIEQPLIRATLIEMAVEQEAALHLVLKVCAWRGKVVSGAQTTEEEMLLRIAVPLLKYSAARLAVRSASEAIELHGGVGYIEDFPLARFYRDAQVLPVWEGTTNILVLDVLRAMEKQKAHEALFAFIERHCHDERLHPAIDLFKQDAAYILKAGELEGQAQARLWCDRAVEFLQMALISENSLDARTKAVAEEYLLRHFSDFEIGGKTRHLSFGEEHKDVLLMFSGAGLS